MSETYSVKAVLSAVDNGLISTIDKAISSLNGITKKSGVFGNTAGNSFRRASESASDFTSSVARLATAIGITQAVTAGINAMKNSMGSAVSRMDTLNNASRVFKNMGFAAGDTSKMMDKLQDSILGFGGSTADVNNAVLQLSQAFSNGKIDGMTWISMMNSQMGPVLSAIAKQMGLTTGQLKDGLASGKISVQQFQDALIELDKNGGDGLDSLHQIALTATGGISTSMQNAKTSVVRGLTEMLKGFDTFAQSVTGLSLSQIIAQIGTAVEGVLDKVAANIPKAAGYFKNLGLTANQSKGLITGFVAAAMGIGALVALEPVIGSVVNAFGSLSSAVTQLRGVFSGLVSFLVSPWGLAVVAIGLVVAALGELYAKFQPFHDAVNNVVSAFVSGFGQAVPQALGLLNGLFASMVTSVQVVADAIKNQLGGSFTSITPQMVSQGIISGLSMVIQFIQNVIAAITQMTAAFINTGAVQAAWQAITAVIQAVGTVIQTVIGIVSQFIGTNAGVNGAESPWRVLGTAIGNVTIFLADAITKIANFITSVSNAIQQLSPFEQRLVGIGLAAGALGAKFLLSSGNAGQLAGSLLGLGGNSDKAKGSLDGISSSSTNLGEQIGIAAAGIGIAAAGIAYLAQQGDAGTTALVGMTAAVVIVIATLAKFAPALQQNAAGITAFGTAMLSLGAGIAIASAGLTLLAQQGDAGTTALISMTAAIVVVIAAFAKFAPVLQQNAAGITAFGAAMVGLGAGLALASTGLTMLATTGNAGLKVIVTLTVSVAALAGVFALLGPSLTSSSAGIVAFGASIAAIGVGIGAASLGIAALVAAFTGLITVMANLNNSSGQLVQNAQALGSAFGVMVVTSIASVAIGLQQLAPLFMQTILTIGLVIADGAPQLAQEFLYLIIGIVQVIAQNLPQLLQAGTQLVVNFILGITNSLGQVIPAALQMITTFINAVAQNIQPVIAAGLNLLVQFLYGLALGLPQVIGAVAEVITTFLTSLAGHIQEIISAGVDLLVNFLKGISNNLGKVVSAVVDVVVSFVKAVANNIQKIIDAGIYLIEKLALGIVRALPKITDMGLKVVTEFVYAVGYALGKVTTSGGKLIVAFAKGVWDGVSGSRKAGDANINAIINAIQNAHLFKHGQELINGFLNGMKSAFKGVKQWVGGIGKWIEKHKGPIQYDRKLLIPAGNAIMQGLNAGLMHSFKDVQGNVSTMAQSIAEAANNNISSNLNNINASLASGNINHMISGQLDVKQQPAYINLNMGGHDYGTFVDDITKQQDVKISLGKFGV